MTPLEYLLSKGVFTPGQIIVTDDLLKEQITVTANLMFQAMLFGSQVPKDMCLEDFMPLFNRFVNQYVDFKERLSENDVKLFYVK